MNKFLKYALAGALSVMTILAAGCGGDKKADTGKADMDKPVIVGVNPGPHAQIMENVKKIAEKKGLKIEIKEFSDFVTPNSALAQGEIWANSFQHEPFLKATLKKEPSFKLVKAFNTALFPINIYSRKLKPGDTIPDGAKIAIPNDPTNGGRSLLLLEKAGIIKLKEGVGEKATVGDIAENKKNIKFQEVEAAQVPRTLDDVDAAVINSNFAMQVNLDPTKDAMFIEDSTSPYVNIIAVREGDENRPEIQALIKVLHSDEIKQFITEKYKGAVVPAF